MEYFNEEDIYDNEISPLMGKIIEICQKNSIPMVASFAYENCEENGIGCCTTTLNTFEDRVVENYADATRAITKRTSLTASVMISK